ncbi:hypothetical protein NQ317_009820 [Molorchus minor]|uniref:Uncharacterized protein n=1 Tax=Molorchus minor TaxID=1323400 RepID=A0ABQ9JW99_9CUCU|nr:hypothetical protein NQ317_009820 [Molorchus minor]
MKVLVLDNNTLEKFKNYYRPPPPIVGGVEERCLQAIQHVATGLNCLKYFPKEDTVQETKIKEEEVKMAKPFEPIPMPYESLIKEKEKEPTKRGKKKDRKKKVQKPQEANANTNALLLKNKNQAQSLPTWREATNISWKDHLKTLLYEKAVLVYAILSNTTLSMANMGPAYEQ